MPRDIRHKLLRWYRLNRRDLPWRRTSDPYRIWVSEIMLQQTQVNTVLPYYKRFIARFPDVRALARAPLGAVLKQWEGLGYYGRARSLHAAAKAVVRDHAGRLPDDREALLALPGIGPYTAGAILSIAFGRAEPVLDGNVERVLCRLLAIRENPRDPAVRKRLWTEAALLVRGLSRTVSDRVRRSSGRVVRASGEGGRTLVRGRDPGDFNQALMELGATVCAPKAPACLLCPVSRDCRARAEGIEEELPALAKRAPVPRRREVAAVIEDGARVLLVRRPERGLLGGLWGFPSAAPARSERPEACALRVAQGLGVAAAPAGMLPVVEHAYTHFHLATTPVRMYAGDTKTAPVADAAWVIPKRMANHPVDRVTRKILDEIATEKKPG